MTESQEKALKCKHFYSTPLGTAIICKKTGKELKSCLHGIEWDDSKCPCKKWKSKEK